jgi:hypothetical protein
MLTRRLWSVVVVLAFGGLWITLTYRLLDAILSRPLLNSSARGLLWSFLISSVAIQVIGVAMSVAERKHKATLMPVVGGSCLGAFIAFIGLAMT